MGGNSGKPSGTEMFAFTIRNTGGKMHPTTVELSQSYQ